MDKQLLEPILEDGILNTHYFNGRLLTAEDLKADQTANRRQHQQLGEAIGEGVVYGLEVSIASAGAINVPPVLGVTRGLALNRRGQAVALRVDVAVALTRQSQPAVEAGLFADCSTLPPGPPGSATEVYVLVGSPADGFDGHVPVSELGSNGKAAGCGRRYAVEGIRFRLLPLPIPDGPGDLNTLRNRLAHLCFGTEALAQVPLDPFAAPLRYGALDQLRDQGGLTDCDVPLALLHWTGGGVQFVDLWSVRRRLGAPLPGPEWPHQIGQRRLAEAEAVWLQFQDQIEALRGQEINAAGIEAGSRFRFLPPAGYLPLGTGGFNRDKFFQGLATERFQLDGAFLRLLVHQSWYLDPIDLRTPPPIRLYEPMAGGQYLLFVRDDRGGPVPVAPTPPPTPTSPPEPDAPARGRMRIIVRVGDAGKAVAFLGSGRMKRADLLIWAEDDVGAQYPASPAFAGTSILVGHSPNIEFRKGAAQFVIPSLPAGDYTVWMRARNFALASRRSQVRPGETATVLFSLVPEKSRPDMVPDKPKPGNKGDWIDPHWFEKVVPFDKYLKWPWPPEVWRNRPPLPDPPPEILDWMRDWAAWLQNQHPKAPIDPADIHIYLDPSHTPDALPDVPYAHVVFGEGGAYLPVALTPIGRTLPRSVAVGKGEISGTGPDVERRLSETGVKELDVLAAGWSGLVVDALDMSPEAAASLLTEARGETDKILREGGLRTFNGVDAARAGALNGVGIHNTVELANAEPQVIATGLAAQGVSLLFAQRLVSEGRQAVPESAWSLRTSDLGLKAQEVAALEEIGISTKGSLKARAAEATTRLGALGVAPAAVTALVENINIGVTASALNAAVVARAPVTRLVGVNETAARTLATLGIANLSDLKAADPARVAAAFNNDTTQATAVIGAASHVIEHGF